MALVTEPNLERTHPLAAARVSHIHSDPEIRALFGRWCGEGDRRARGELIERLLPLAHRLANRYRHSSQPHDDLFQVASLGLVNAVDRYDPARNRPFLSFALPTILGELRRHFRDHAWALHLPRELNERVLTVERAVERLSERNGRHPAVGDVALETGFSDESVLDALAAGTADRALSLDAPTAQDPERESLAAFIGDDDDGFEFVEEWNTVFDALGELPPRDREILRLRYAEDLSQRAIGQRMGISQMQVSRVLRGTVVKLRTIVETPA